MNTGLLIGFALVLTRVAGFFAFIPLPGGKAGPEAARIVLALGFTLGLVSSWPVMAADLSAGRFVVWMLAEAAFGVTIGLAVACLAEGFLMAAQIAGLQAGYGYASTIDPATQADATVLLVLAQLIAGLLFFAMGLDREILLIFARNLASHPPGSFAVSSEAASTLGHLTAGIFTTGLRLALPVVALLALVDLALALRGRLHAQLQLVTLAFPAKMLAALGLLAALASLYARIYGSNARDMLQVAARLAGI
jgi:flagellar biosynthetic protein FliR